MRSLIVVTNPDRWPFDIPGVEVVAARAYLTDPAYVAQRGIRVYNLCRSYRYQSLGYYVSLLAEARGHRPLPDVATTQDLKSSVVARILSAEVDDLIQKSLAPLKADRFVLSIYFARNTARAYDRLCQSLYNQFQAPLMRATFVRRDESWEMQDISSISASDVPESHRPFVAEVAAAFFEGRRPTRKPKVPPRYTMGILYDPTEAHKPSDEKAIQKFIRSAERHDVAAEIITRDDYSRLAEFDALFIRQTTSVNHFTFRFASRAQAEGLVVVDDPQSILRCTNKVYLAELLERHDILAPKTIIVHRDNLNEVCEALGFPIILKQPDSAFSQGVKKVKTREEFDATTTTLFKDTELLIAQEFLQTDYDWRIGVLDRKPIYAAKYFMARKHWQIIANVEDGDADYGKVEAVPVELVPQAVVRAAVKAAGLIGEGLYGVDVKQVGRLAYVIEVNDNPSIDSGYEDTLLKDALYDRVIEYFVRKLDRLKERRIEE
ncbi:RimK family protein [Synoicihabitans lomoniglobus]|uniref:RimK family protein n=1 Tax=Synoicihabitans lomoniglobus TaxID=2909285 RepID=A0AAE9ZYY9_9BACT|nr:RimK family protein [Opitutaceae bacterium LMO-M01]WED63853.1 RimK family protein [Opitutaceae bacterium LMO-M01]